MGKSEVCAVLRRKDWNCATVDSAYLIEWAGFPAEGVLSATERLLVNAWMYHGCLAKSEGLLVIETPLVYYVRDAAYASLPRGLLKFLRGVVLLQAAPSILVNRRKKSKCGSTEPSHVERELEEELEEAERIGRVAKVPIWKVESGDVEEPLIVAERVRDAVMEILGMQAGEELPPSSTPVEEGEESGNHNASVVEEGSASSSS